MAVKRTFYLVKFYTGSFYLVSSPDPFGTWVAPPEPEKGRMVDEFDTLEEAWAAGMAWQNERSQFPLSELMEGQKHGCV